MMKNILSAHSNKDFEFDEVGIFRDSRYFNSLVEYYTAVENLFADFMNGYVLPLLSRSFKLTKDFSIGRMLDCLINQIFGRASSDSHPYMME